MVANWFKLAGGAREEGLTVHPCGPGGWESGECCGSKRTALRPWESSLGVRHPRSYARSNVVSKLRDAHCCQPNLGWFLHFFHTVGNHHCQVPPTKWVEIGFCQLFLDAGPQPNTVQDLGQVQQSSPLPQTGAFVGLWLDNQPNWPNAQHDGSFRHWPKPPNVNGNETSCCASASAPRTSKMVCNIATRFCRATPRMAMSTPETPSAARSLPGWTRTSITTANSCRSFTNGMGWKRTCYSSDFRLKNSCTHWCPIWSPKDLQPLPCRWQLLGSSPDHCSWHPDSGLCSDDVDVLRLNTSSVPHLRFSVVH